MKNTVVLGAQFGDEAKARMAHYFSLEYKYAVRFNGSENSGHTIYSNGKKIVRHHLPSADFRYSNCYAFLSAGMVINPVSLLEEVKQTCQDFPQAKGKIIIDPNAFVILPKHIDEDKEKNKHIGSTNKGIGPAYTDKTARSGLRISSIMNPKSEFYDINPKSELYNVYLQLLNDFGVSFRTAYQMMPEFKSSKCLFEGAQGLLLDLNHGTYPFVTSCDCSLSGLGAAGFNWALNNVDVYGVCKPYVTRVGSGPFPTEYSEEESEQLRTKGGEFGATTGRARRIGALDLPALRYACQVGGVTHLIMTKLDILFGQEKVKVCTEYKNPVIGPESFFDAKPIYQDVPGWKDMQDGNLQDFLSLVEKEVGCKIIYTSYGVNPEDVKRR